VRTVRLQVTLRGVTPAVLRVVDVPASCTLSELHDLLLGAQINVQRRALA
jgi:hypothetical protein